MPYSRYSVSGLSKGIDPLSYSQKTLYSQGDLTSLPHFTQGQAKKYPYGRVATPRGFGVLWEATIVDVVFIISFIAINIYLFMY